MAKSTSCFPSFKCFSKSRMNSGAKLRSAIRMPTLREFLLTSNNTGTQTAISGLTSHRLGFDHTDSLNSKKNASYKSTIAIKKDKSFVPLSNFESFASKEQKSPDVSRVSRQSESSNKTNTLFMSKGSFDAIFMKIEESRKNPNSKIFENISTESKKINPIKIRNPFVVDDKRMPRIVPITPKKRKRSAGDSRPSIRLSLKPLLMNAKDSEYLCSTSTSRILKMQFCQELEQVNFMK